jgi:predicted chitinase
MTRPLPISNLERASIRELQVGLARLGYAIGEIDGAIGPRTRNAWAEFKTDLWPGNPDLVGPQSVRLLKDNVAALAAIEAGDLTTRAGFTGAVRAECTALGIGQPAQIAYVLASVQWETAQTFQPVREAYWRNETWRQINLAYQPYYGRGYVQLTWHNNYQKYSDILSLDLVNNPDLALEPNVALFVLVHGLKTGSFTGRKITDYINDSTTDFVGARRCINGTDKANEIAKIAQAFLGS